MPQQHVKSVTGSLRRKIILVIEREHRSRDVEHTSSRCRYVTFIPNQHVPSDEMILRTGIVHIATLDTLPTKIADDVFDNCKRDIASHLLLDSLL